MDYSRTVSTVSNLGNFPICYRRQIEEAGDSARVLDGQLTNESFTSGTTGPAFAYAIGQREQSALRSYYEASFRLQDLPVRRRAIRFLDQAITFDRRIPTPIHFHDLSIHRKGSFTHAINRILSKDFAENGVEANCSILSASERVLRAFTDAARQMCPAEFSSPVTHLFTFGSLLTAEARTEYEDFWSATIIDRYGLAETVGAATEDELGWYLFDPILIPEVVGVSSRTPIKEGVGILVLTTLFPFQETQPFVRYWTDDVVEVTHCRGSIPGRFAVRPLGRRPLGISLPRSDTWLLTPDVVFRALESRTDIDRAPLFVDCDQVLDHRRAGLPKRRLSTSIAGGKTVVTLHVGIRAPATECQNVLDEIKADVLDRSESLRTACHLGFCELRVAHADDPEDPAGHNTIIPTAVV